MTDQLSELSMLPSNQKYICISFLSNKENDKHTVTGVRFGGAFDTYEQACEQAKIIQQFDQAHHVFVGEGGKWLPFDPDPNSKVVNDSEYANEQLNSLMKGHKTSMGQSKIFHEIRKTEKMMENINENLQRRQTNKDELTKKLSKVKNIDEAKTLTTSLENIDEQIKKMEVRLKSCQENDQSLRKDLEKTSQ
jgi:hypothetical protein